MPKIIIARPKEFVDANISIFESIRNNQFLDFTEKGFLTELVVNAEKLNITIDNLVKHFRIAKNTISKKINSLIAKGYLSRVQCYTRDMSSSNRISCKTYYFLHEDSISSSLIVDRKICDNEALSKPEYNQYLTKVPIVDRKNCDTYIVLRTILFFNYSFKDINKNIKFNLLNFQHRKNCDTTNCDSLLHKETVIKIFPDSKKYKPILLAIKGNGSEKNKKASLPRRRRRAAELNSSPVDLDKWLNYNINSHARDISDLKMELFSRRIYPEGIATRRILEYWNNFASKATINNKNGRKKIPKHRLIDSQTLHVCQVIITALIRLYGKNEEDIKFAIDNYQKILHNSPWYDWIYNFPQFYANQKLFEDCIEGKVDSNPRYFRYHSLPKVIEDKDVLLKLAYDQFFGEWGRKPSKAERIAIQSELGLHRGG